MEFHKLMTNEKSSQCPPKSTKSVEVSATTQLADTFLGSALLKQTIGFWVEGARYVSTTTIFGVKDFTMEET